MHIFEKNSVFTRPGPRSLIGYFPFSQVEKRTVLENGALGSLKVAKNGHQERSFSCFFAGADFGLFFYPFLSAQERAKSGQERAKSGQERPKSGQERPKSGQERPKSGQERPKSGQERPKSGQERAKSGQERPKSA